MLQYSKVLKISNSKFLIIIKIYQDNLNCNHKKWVDGDGWMDVKAISKIALSKLKVNLNDHKL